jgi:hypothetical protein
MPGDDLWASVDVHDAFVGQRAGKQVPSKGRLACPVRASHNDAAAAMA